MPEPGWIVITLLIVTVVGAGLGSLLLAFWVQTSDRSRELTRQLDDLRREHRDLAARLESLATRPAEATAAPLPQSTATATARTSPPIPLSVPPRPDSAPEPATAPLSPAPPPASPSLAEPSSSRPTPALPSRGLEERLGAHLFVWIGGIALALAGVFLVKYSFERGLLSPVVRLILGAVLGATLLGAGEWFLPRSRRIAAALGGASMAVFFACIFSAYQLYHLVGAVPALVLMTAVTASAVGLSLRYGQAVAVIGLLGGFLTPTLVGELGDSRLPMLIYLLLIQIGLTAASRASGWLLLPALTLIATFFWAVLLTLFPLGRTDAIWIQLFLMLSSGVYLVHATAAAVAQERQLSAPGRGARYALAGVAMALTVGLNGIHQWRLAFDEVSLGLYVLMGLAILVLARLQPRYAAMAWLAGAFSLAIVGSWALTLQDAMGWLAITHPTHGEVWMAALLLGSLYAIGCYGAMWRSGRECHWAAGSITAAITFAPILWLSMDPKFWPTWAHAATITSLAATVYLAAALPMTLRRMARPTGESALGILLGGSVTLGCMALWMALDFAWPIPTGLVLIAGFASLTHWRRIDVLPGFLAVLALLHLLPLLWLFPGAGTFAVADRPLWNEYLAIFAIAGGALGWTAWSLRQVPDVHAAMRFFALVTGGLGTVILIRHSFSLLPASHPLWEFATHGNALLGMALLLWRWRTPPPWPQRVMAWLTTTGATLAILGGTLLWANPLGSAESVGAWPVINGLLYLYLLPLVLMLAIAHPLRREDDPALLGLAHTLSAIALVLLFALISLQVRQFYAGTHLHLHGVPVSMLEWYSYSVAWIALGITLALTGIRRSSHALRYASLAIMLLAIFKVFLLDTARLEGLYRVVSLLGLGVSLIVLGYLYQKLVFGRPAQPAAVPDTDQPAA